MTLAVCVTCGEVGDGGPAHGCRGTHDPAEVVAVHDLLEAWERLGGVEAELVETLAEVDRRPDLGRDDCAWLARFVEGSAPDIPGRWDNILIALRAVSARAEAS